MPDLEESAPVEDTQNLAAADTSAGKSNFESLPPHLETKWDEIRSTSPLKQRRSSLDRLFDWSEHFDESSGAYWYYNNCTGESSWMQPKGWAAYSEAPVKPTDFDQINLGVSNDDE